MRYDLQCWNAEGRLVYRARERTQLGVECIVGWLLEEDQPFTLSLVRVVRRGSVRAGGIRAWVIDPKTREWAVDVREPQQPSCGR